MIGPFPATLPGTLAQSGSSVFVWLVALLVLVIGGAIAVVLIRRRLSPNEDFHGEGFTLGDLRRLHKSGQLSDEEFEKAKQGLISAAQTADSRKQQDPKDVRDLGLR